MNNVTGDCSGQGRIKFRAAENEKLNDIKSKLQDQGFSLQDPEGASQRKNSNIEKAAFVDAKHAKIATLASNGDVFGTMNQTFTENFKNSIANDASK